MILALFVALISLSFLLTLHEFGHFVLAKKLGMKVEEFGIGYPPRIIGKKFGETLYSFNLLPFGALVRVREEEKSFSTKKIWQETLVAAGGVISFWIIAVFLLSIVMGSGIETVIQDEESSGFSNPKVQILSLAPDSPADRADLIVGDIIRELQIKNEKLKINRVKEIQEFTSQHKGEEITLTIQRLQPSHRPPAEGGLLGKEMFDVTLVPRVLPPEGEGPLGVALIRTGLKTYPWYEVPFRGAMYTINLTFGIINGWASALKNVFLGLPTQMQLIGPIGIVDLFAKATELGINYYLQFIALISIHLALFNLLPIPAVDGGKLLFLGITFFRKKPIPQKIEERVTAFFFSLLIVLSFWIAIKDIVRIF